MPHNCTIEFPPEFVDRFQTSSFNVTLVELPSYEETRIIRLNQSYEVKICMELDSEIKKLICADWCACVQVESSGPGPEIEKCDRIRMNNCDSDEPDCISISLSGAEIAGPGPHEPGADHCGHVSFLTVTMMAISREECGSDPLGIAGFCRVGPVMVYS